MTPEILELFVKLNHVAQRGSEDEMWRVKNQLDELLKTQHLVTVEDITHNCFTIGHEDFVVWIQ
jgi:hypothetical protein